MIQKRLSQKHADDTDETDFTFGEIATLSSLCSQILKSYIVDYQKKICVYLLNLCYLRAKTLLR